MGIFNVKECNFVFAFYSIFTFKQIFPKKGPIFPKNVGFSGNLWENGCFPQLAAVSLHQLSARSELLTNEPKKEGEVLFLFIMETKIMRVVQQGEAFAVQSQKSENGQMMKCNIVLQEMGGKYENQYAAAMLGNAAQCKFYPDDLVAVTLRFTTHEHNGQVYQDILVTDIEKAFLKVKG